MLQVLSRSASFDKHLDSVLPTGTEYRILRTPNVLLSNSGVLVIHGPSAGKELNSALQSAQGLTVAVASDMPSATEMLALSSFGLRGYFHSYMGDVHYRQMLEMLEGGQTWFAPPILSEIIALARDAATSKPNGNWAEVLTPREREVAQAVAEGLSNKRIGARQGISERTVKAHLTHIYEKLEVEDRVGLALLVKGHRPMPA